jgi:hypothetical protein
MNDERPQIDWGKVRQPWMTVTEYNEGAALIRRHAGLLLNAPSQVRAALMEGGLPEEAVAKLPAMLEGETETRLKELVAHAPIELGRDLRFVERARQEFLDALDGLRDAWDACVTAAKIWDDLVRPQTAFEKAVEAQRAKSKLRLVKDDDDDER